MKRAPDFSALPDWGTNKRRLTKLDRGSLAFDTQTEPTIDESAMAATTVISTPAPDRVKDSMNPNGCRLDNYRKNPIVLYEHGFCGMLPVGKSSDQDERLTIAISEAAVLGTCYFSQKSLEAAQIFDLVTEKIIRAASIRFSPIKSSVLRDDDGEVYGFDEWDLEEWSWVTIPCNPEAVTGVISKGRLAGKPIIEPILKSLQLWLPERAVMARGWNPDKDNPVAKSNNKPNAKSITKADDTDEEVPVDAAAGEGADAGKPADEVPADEPNSEPTVKPLGAQMATAAHGMMTQLLSGLEQEVGLLEQPDMKAAFEEFLTAAKGCQTILSEAYRSVYGSDMDAPAEEGGDDEMKSYLAANRIARMQLAGVGQELKSLAGEKNLTAPQKKSLDAVSRQLGAMLAKASVAKPVEKPAQIKSTPELQQQIDETKTMFSDIKKMIADVLPGNSAA